MRDEGASLEGMPIDLGDDEPYLSRFHSVHYRPPETTYRTVPLTLGLPKPEGNRKQRRAQAANNRGKA